MTDSIAVRHYARELEAWDSEDLFRAAHDVAAMVESPGWAVVAGLVDGAKQRAMRELVVTQGQRSEADLRRQLGYLQGVDEAQGAIEAVGEIARRVEQRLTAAAQNGGE